MAKAEQTQDRKITPAAEKKAQELGVDLAQIEGTGADGNVTVEDVEAAIKNIEEARAAEQKASEELKAAEEALAAEEATADGRRIYKVRVNPALGQGVDGVEVAGRWFTGGEKITKAEFDGFGKSNTDTQKRKLILLGAEVK